MKLRKSDRIKALAVGIFLTELTVVLLLKYAFKANVEYLLFAFLFVNAGEIIYLFFVNAMDKKQRDIEISRILGNDAQAAFNYGKVGIIIFDEDYFITWVSDYLVENGFNILNEKLTKAIEGIHVLFTDDVASVTLDYNGKKYQFVRSEEGTAVFVKDVTDFYELSKTYENEKLVLGLINFDNYDETIQTEDEKKIAKINTGIRQKVISWIMEYKGVVRKIRSDRFLVICDQQCFKNMVASRFNILETVKKEAKRLDVDITTSMSFAYGSSDIEELDSTINSMMELALSRGGDQVVVKQVGKEIEYYGTSSEASEKTSKVKARVMAKGLAGIVDDASKIFIIPHNVADLDALGACIAMDDIVHSRKRESYIIFSDFKIEPKTEEIYENNALNLIERHTFLSEQEALDILDDDSLVIALDHHTLELNAARNLTEKCKQVIIIDHHRRMNEANIPAMMIYNEPSASSTVELVSELLQYQNKNVELTDLEASIMYSGLLVDTENLKSRCSTRTFEVCAFLRKEGADISLVNDWLKDSVDDFIQRSKLTNTMEVVGNHIAIAALDDEIINRTDLAKAANSMNGLKDIEASFAIAKIDKETCGISARSNGKVNVQIIMEKLGGGGHFAAAALQRNDCTVMQLKSELIDVIKEYMQGEQENESNSIN